MHESIKLVPSNRVALMLPSPHIHSVEVEDAPNPSVEEAYIASVNAENKALRDGADYRTLPLLSSIVRLQEATYDGVTDKLSGLLNREGIELWFSRYQPMKFLVIKSDGIAFGEINKKYGHDAGDRVIQHIGKEVASKLRTDRRQVDNDQRKKKTTRFDAIASVTSRWGGDEFLSVVDLSDVADSNLENAKGSVMSRFQNFGTFVDSKVGQIEIEFRSAGMLGKLADNKPLSYYQSIVDHELREITTN